MAYSAKILLDSLAPSGHRLTTLEITFPRFVLAEFNTHRQLSRNSASSRAIPVERMLQRVMEDPVLPVWWGRNQKGMQAEGEIEPAERGSAIATWLCCRDDAVKHVKHLLALDVHKQIANRLLEPWLWHTVIVTATEWQNFFALRCHPDAQPEMRRIAEMMRNLYYSQEPQRVPAGWWHLPLTGFPGDEALDGDDLRKVSMARCARVSYLTHDGTRDVEADLALCERLVSAGHLSPSEHQAAAMASCSPEGSARSGNFMGWIQHRKLISGECRTYRPG
jgi:hypothetical protein